VLAGAPLVPHESQYDDVSVSQAIASIRQSTAYLVWAAVFVYIPAVSHGALWLTRASVVSIVAIVSGFRWLFRLHRLESFDTLGEFLSTPLPLGPQGEPRALIELEKEDIEALHAWVLSRRGVVQNRLVPTTLLLTVLGLLANTSWGESAVRTAADILRDYFQSSGGLSWLVAFGRFGLLMAVIVLPAGLIARLLSEAFVMDYIAQACVLARHVRAVSPATSTTDRRASASPGLLSRLKQWLVGRGG